MNNETVSKSLSAKRAVKALGYAASGIRYAFYSEPAFLRIVIAEAVIGTLLLWYLWPLSAHEAALLVLAAVLMPITEIINTSIETLVDMVKPEYDIRVKRIKDCAAGATLLSTSAAVFICIIVVLGH